MSLQGITAAPPAFETQTAGGELRIKVPNRSEARIGLRCRDPRFEHGAGPLPNAGMRVKLPLTHGVRRAPALNYALSKNQNPSAKQLPVMNHRVVRSMATPLFKHVHSTIPEEHGTLWTVRSFKYDQLLLPARQKSQTASMAAWHGAAM